MITEQEKDKVYFSKLLRSDYPRIYKDVCDILDANNVAHDTLHFTKDYWCRDYMPIQCSCDRFVQFLYNPDYLRGKEKYITNTTEVIAKTNIRNKKIEQSSLVIDGGNVVVCKVDSQKSILVMTDKVMKENSKFSKQEIETLILKAFKHKELPSSNEDTILWLPWDKKDICGHTDGILRFVDNHNGEKPVVLTNLSVYDEEIANRMRSILNEYFEIKELILSEPDELSWAYINALQTRDIIIVPGIGNAKLDNESMEQFNALYPKYRGRIYQVQMKAFIKNGGGALNCCTWTVSEDMPTMIPNRER